MTGARSIFKRFGPSSVMQIRWIAIDRPRGAPSWFPIGPAFYPPIALRRAHERPTRAEVPFGILGTAILFLPPTGGLSRGDADVGLTVVLPIAIAVAPMDHAAGFVATDIIG